MTAIQGLGIELLTYIRCPTCGKVLASLDQEYNRLIKLAQSDINSKIPFNFPPEAKLRLYNELFEVYYNAIMSKLGIKRICCMMRLKNPQQISVPNPINPPGNVAVNRQSITTTGENVKRSVTRIELTKRSRVPGKSNINMMSITGYEDTLKNQDDLLELQMRRDLDLSNSVENYSIQKMEDITFAPSSGPSVYQMPLVPTVPVIQTGAVREIKRPKVKNVVYNSPSLISGPSGSSGPTVHAGPAVPDYMEIDFPTFSNIPTISDQSYVDETRFIDLEKMNLFQ